MDPDNLPEGDLKTMNFGGGEGSKAKAWKDIWGSRPGHRRGERGRQRGRLHREAEARVLRGARTLGAVVATRGGRLTPAGRFPLIDAVKGLACTLIVWHHMAIYGPMGQGARSLWPAFFDWLAQDGRLAVQVFLALGGFLAAASLAPQGLLVAERPWKRIALRYARLVMPYLVALSCAVLAAALVRPWLDAELVPAAPTLAQLFAHGLLLQDLLGHEALSAGVWYVAIDFQLYALALVLLSLGALPRRGAVVGDQRARWLAVALVLAVAAVSLAVFNRHAGLDSTALYFFGAYGLGMLGWWIGQATRASTWGIGVAALALLGTAALWIDWRSRIAIALVTALALAIAQRRQLAVGGPLARAECAAAGHRPHLLLAVPDPLSGDPAGQRAVRSPGAGAAVDRCAGHAGHLRSVARGRGAALPLG